MKGKQRVNRMNRSGKCKNQLFNLLFTYNRLLFMLFGANVGVHVHVKRATSFALNSYSKLEF